MRVSRFAEKKSRFFFQMFFARVSECVSIPAGMREQMNFCLCIFYRIFYPFKRDKRDKCENSRGWSVSLCLALSRFVSLCLALSRFVSLVSLAGWSAADA